MRLVFLTLFSFLISLTSFADDTSRIDVEEVMLTKRPKNRFSMGAIKPLSFVHDVGHTDQYGLMQLTKAPHVHPYNPSHSQETVVTFHTKGFSPELLASLPAEMKAKIGDAGLDALDFFYVVQRRQGPGFFDIPNPAVKAEMQLALKPQYWALPTYRGQVAASKFTERVDVDACVFDYASQTFTDYGRKGISIHTGGLLAVVSSGNSHHIPGRTIDDSVCLLSYIKHGDRHALTLHHLMNYGDWKPFSEKLGARLGKSATKVEELSLKLFMESLSTHGATHSADHPLHQMHKSLQQFFKISAEVVGAAAGGGGGGGAGGGE